MAEKLLALGEMYDLRKLKYLVERVILKSVDKSNAVHHLKQGDKFNSEDLKAFSTRIICTNFPEIVETDEWKALEREKPELIVEITRKIAEGYKIAPIPTNTWS